MAVLSITANVFLVTGVSQFLPQSAKADSPTSTVDFSVDANGHGSLTGTLHQTNVPYDGNATSVTAVPDDGYSFAG